MGRELGLGALGGYSYLVEYLEINEIIVIYGHRPQDHRVGPPERGVWIPQAWQVNKRLIVYNVTAKIITSNTCRN